MSNAAQSVIGRILLWIGFLIGAVATVSFLEIKPDPAGGEPVNGSAQSDTAPAEGDASASSPESRLDKAAGSWETWKTIPWVTYGIGLMIGVFGSVMIHRSKRRHFEERTSDAASLDVLQTHMDELVARLDELNRSVREMRPEAVLAFIDNRCQPPFNEFADGRMAMADHFGLAAFAQVMSEVASAERFTNRAWSAAADGYVDEVAASVETASQHIRLAAKLFGELHQR